MKPGIESDSPKSNFFVALCGSLVANVFLWAALGEGSNQPVPVLKARELIFDRVVAEKHPDKNKPIFHPILPKRPPPEPPKKETQKLDRTPKPPPQGAHNRFVTSKPTAKSPDSGFVVPAGGNAQLGKPTDAQNAGNGVVNPPAPPPVVTQPTAPPPPVTPKTNDTPPPSAPPAPVKHEDAPPPPPPAPPKPKGETREAKADHQENVEIPESLKSQSFKSFVRVRINISADGKFTATLRTSSGNTDVDKLVLDTLNKWTWKPALKDGEPVDSVQNFRFNFSIE
jgi:TonB family protein